MRRFILILALLVAGCGDEHSPTQQAMQKWVGTDASGIVVKTIDGEAQPFADLKLTEDLGGAAGKPVVVNVWATWCPPCLEELPSLDALGKSGRAHVIAIATDRDAQTVKDFLRTQTYGSGFTVWHDPNGILMRGELGVTALPVSFVLDETLHVTQVEAGARDWVKLRLR